MVEHCWYIRNEAGPLTQLISLFLPAMSGICLPVEILWYHKEYKCFLRYLTHWGHPYCHLSWVVGCNVGWALCKWHLAEYIFHEYGKEQYVKSHYKDYFSSKGRIHVLEKAISVCCLAVCLGCFNRKGLHFWMCSLFCQCVEWATSLRPPWGVSETHVSFSFPFH